MRAMRIVPGIAVGLTALVTAGCAGSSAHSGRTVVVASFYPLAFVAQEVAGPSVDVHNLTPTGSEPHDIELRPRDVALIQDADVVLYLSHGFQPAVERAVAEARGKRVDALAGARVVDDNPHVWLDPVRFAGVVRRIARALGHPTRGDALARRVLALDAEYRRGLAHCTRHEFVTTHEAFGYLAARYGLQQVAITGIDPESEPNARRLRDLAALVRRDHIPTVFFERLVSPKIAQTLAREAGVGTAVLDPIEGLTPAEQRKGENYFTLMRRNLSNLRTALECR
jgi:zinc transport system substrate-binding protein